MILDRTQAPTAQKLEKRVLPSFSKHRLQNGIDVYLLPFGAVPLVEIRAIYKAGAGYQPKIGLASYALRNMLEGTRNHTSLQLAQRLDDYGAFFRGDVGVEYCALQLATVSKHLKPTLDLFKEVIFEPSFPKEEFIKMQERSLQKLAVSKEKTSYRAARSFRHALFGAHHPYGMHSGPDEVKAIQYTDLREYYENYLYPGNFCLTVCGVFDEKETLKILEDTFGEIVEKQAINADSLAKTAIPNNETGRKLLSHPGMQATVRLGHLGFERSHPDFYKMQVVNTILGGYFGSRLMKNIREEKGYTYGIYSGWNASKYHGSFAVQADVGNEYIEPTIKEVKKEINKLIDKGVDESELQLVKNYVLGQAVNRRETAFQISSILNFAISNDLGFEELDRRLDVILAIQAKEISELAGKYIKPDDMLEVICGGGQ